MPNARDVPMRLVPSRTREDETNHFSPARNLRTKPHRRPVGEDSRPQPYRTKYSLQEECRLFLVPLSYRARLADPAAHLSPQRKENPPPRSTTPFPPPATLHRPANPNLAHRHGYRKRDRQVSSRIHPTPKQATESGETEKRERAPTEQPHARLCI